MDGQITNRGIRPQPSAALRRRPSRAGDLFLSAEGEFRMCVAALFPSRLVSRFEIGLRLQLFGRAGALTTSGPGKEHGEPSLRLRDRQTAIGTGITQGWREVHTETELMAMSMSESNCPPSCVA